MRRFPILLSVLAVALLAWAAVAPTGPTIAQEGPDLAGSWRIEASRADGVRFVFFSTFGADGTVLASGVPAQPAPPGTPPGVIFFNTAHGTWEATGPDTANVTFIHLRSGAEGQPLGTVTVRLAVTLADDGQAFSGEAAAVMADPAGAMLASFSSTHQATRIVAEPPSAAATPTS